MSKLGELIRELCPNGVEFCKIKDELREAIRTIIEEIEV